MSVRTERDSMGTMEVPAEAYYGASTARAVLNFPISGRGFGRRFLRALGMVKKACAQANLDLGLLDAKKAEAIVGAADEVIEGKLDQHFVVDIFQTGSGTSTNMNANEVLATLATARLGQKVHPNDHINMSQSSNDVIPTAIHVSAYLAIVEELIPALQHLHETLMKKAKAVDSVVTTGRTHLMDAMPVRLGQELGGWASQIAHGIERIEATLPRLAELAQGGTAVGTGINAHPQFGEAIANELAQMTGLPLKTSGNYFESLSTQDAAVEVSGQLKTVATSLMKIANDLRWMNSGPIAGFGEIALPALQPGSSIMPGKINPVIPEAVTMVCAQVMGNDVTITIGGQSGNFQLNVMLPVVAYNLLQSITLLANGSRLLADMAIAGFTVNEERIASLVGRNPILVTALNPVIGYELGAKIAKQAYAEGRLLKDVALEQTSLSGEELDRLLDPRQLTEGGIQEA
ncbi:MAG: class II fumarate hydratase [Candidatus Eremiobacteraeota bacterium]|nr:class II fumarate hydratase [Candidatus Eremiobacteraeota bacterium]